MGEAAGVSTIAFAALEELARHCTLRWRWGDPRGDRQAGEAQAARGGQDVLKSLDALAELLIDSVNEVLPLLVMGAKLLLKRRREAYGHSGILLVQQGTNDAGDGIKLDLDLVLDAFLNLQGDRLLLSTPRGFLWYLCSSLLVGEDCL